MGHHDVSARPALDAARILDRRQPPPHLPAIEADDDDMRLGVRRGQRQRLAAGGPPPPGERRQTGQAEADERPAVQLHAFHYGARRAAGPCGSGGSEHDHAGVVAQRAVVGRGDGLEHGRRGRGGRGVVQRLQGAAQPALAERLAARRGALEDAVGDQDDELVGRDRRGRGLGRRVEPVEPEDRAVAAF